MIRRNKKRKKRIVIILSAIVLIILSIIGYNYGIDYYRKYYACPGIKIDSYRFPVIGIDVASHQGEINWEEVYASKVNFAFIKATEGETFVDKKFEYNFSQAKKNNIIAPMYIINSAPAYRFHTSPNETTMYIR